MIKLNMGNNKNNFEELISNLSMLKPTKEPYYYSDNLILYNDNCLEVLANIPENSIDMIFADPPYLLSNNGFTCQNGRRVAVNKGKWDQSNGFEEDLAFHNVWITECRRILKPEGTIWISGTYHNIYQCGYLLQKNNFHILNDVAWFKPNAAPNLSCRFFTASHETLLWARKEKKAKHTFNYESMKNGCFPEDKIKKENAQMRSVWHIPTAGKDEKEFGRHPTQKPLSLLNRIILASTKAEDIILDPFSGGGTTGAACLSVGGRYCIGIEIDREYCKLSVEKFRNMQGRSLVSFETLT
ncbi:MAG: site-specific DNA-methyltransferase [Deferribacteraceae bacterium]|jgi:site-specific DNA-methyltransferase (adenine-specific)|nr:site-specific DNA-methyltransferase [Deferribacteraceae bacterium]